VRRVREGLGKLEGLMEHHLSETPVSVNWPGGESNRDQTEAGTNKVTECRRLSDTTEEGERGLSGKNK